MLTALFRLSGDPGRNFTCGGINRNLTGGKNKAVYNITLRIGANGTGCMACLDLLHVPISLVQFRGIVSHHLGNINTLRTDKLALTAGDAIGRTGYAGFL